MRERKNSAFTANNLERARVHLQKKDIRSIFVLYGIPANINKGRARGDFKRYTEQGDMFLPPKYLIEGLASTIEEIDRIEAKAKAETAPARQRAVA